VTRPHDQDVELSLPSLSARGHTRKDSENQPRHAVDEGAPAQ
jgi:hypothetical protein